MKHPLAVIGQGAVTPAGVGLKALLGGVPTPVETALLGEPARRAPVFRVDLAAPELIRWQKEARLRRASPMTLFMIEAAAQALAGRGDREATGLVVALSAGCLVYSRRFFDGIVRRGPRAASPALFPETVFNTPGSHVAAVLGLNGAVYAEVGDESAWVGALKTASLWLARRRVRQVIVLGVEEFDPLALDAYRSARWLRGGFVASEGAAAVLVRSAQPGDELAITDAHEGLVHRTKAEAWCAAQNLLRDTAPALPCFRSAEGTWMAQLEKFATAGRPDFPSPRLPYLGEAFTASAAWNTLRAAAMLPPGRGVVPLWGLNHRLARLQLERR